MAARQSLGLGSALLVANPLPPEDALDAQLHDWTLTSGMAASAEAGVTGKDVTPFLLDWFHRETGGASLVANIAIIVNNAALAAQIAVAAAPAALQA